jgi:hypothetical protein
VIKLREGQLVEITWVDCYGSAGWEYVGDCPKPPTIKSVGYFLKYAHKGLYLASGLSDKEDGSVLAPAWIPDGCVQKIRRLK